MASEINQSIRQNGLVSKKTFELVKDARNLVSIKITVTNERLY